MNKQILEEVIKCNDEKLRKSDPFYQSMPRDDLNHLIKQILSDERLSKGVDVDSLVDHIEKHMNYLNQFKKTSMMEVYKFFDVLKEIHGESCKILSTVAPVEDKWVTLYHGSPVIIDDHSIAAGTFFTDDILVAKDYGCYVYRLMIQSNRKDVLQKCILNEHWVAHGHIPMSYIDLVIEPPTPPINEEHLETERSEGTHKPSKEEV
jgi:hypothetical protein